jgi:protease-4
MYRLIEQLERLGEQRGPVVLLELEDLRFGWAQTEEVREALLRLRARGGQVAVYLRGGGLKEYFLASAAARIYAHPHARLSVVGLRVEVFFFADLLARLGARAEFVRIAEYKSRPEQFEQRTSSEPSATQRQAADDGHVEPPGAA